MGIFSLCTIEKKSKNSKRASYGLNIQCRNAEFLPGFARLKAGTENRSRGGVGQFRSQKSDRKCSTPHGCHAVTILYNLTCSTGTWVRVAAVYIPLALRLPDAL